MAAQTTEVNEENCMDLEVDSVVEMLHTSAQAFEINKDDIWENEKTTSEVVSTLAAKDTEVLTMPNSDVTENVGINFKESFLIEKKSAMEELLSDADTEETCACAVVGGNNEGKEDNIGSSPNLLGCDYDNIPEWKKELLQRRKTKIARTIGANQINSMCIKKDFKSTSPVTPLTKTLTNSINNNNSSKNSSHQITSKLLPITTATITHQTTNGAARTHLSCSAGHYTTVNSSQSHTHQPQQICGIGILTTNTSLETKSTSSSSQSFSVITTSSNSTLKGDDFNNSSSELNNQSSTLYTETNFKSSSINSNNNNNSSGTCQITLQAKQQENQFEQPDSTSNTSSSQEQLQQPFQLHSKHDIVKSSLSSTASCTTTVSPPAICILSTAINNSNTSFVKNPSVGKTSLNKANKYKLSAKLNLPSSNGSVVTSFQTKKMVAMQQMDISDTSVDLDFDPSEELQYGPGIVSKLRCRYLSLALRQSVGKQRPPLDNLRRATSLNNLLDDDDDSNNGSVIDHVDHAENNSRNNINTCSISATSPDEFVASFQKNLKISDKDKQRSRQLKRGNDSLKRARSVEALLGCDKSWDHMNNIGNSNSGEKAQTKQLYHRLDGINNVHDLCSINSAADVTIEDKISHARERILCEKTPKRLTSIIDDTERPPPDVVKQTLKIFEATANRRGRGLSRNNCSGEVAAKVANYKSIISQEKPPVIFPKPPLSPKRQFKKPNNLDISQGKRNVTSNNSANITTKKINPASPISNLTKKFTNLDAFNETCEKNSLEQASHHNNQQSGSTSPLPSVSGGHRADVTLRHRHNFMAKNESTPIRSSFDSNSNSPSRTPDLIPRKHFENSLFSESLSPVTQLTKNVEKLRIELSPLPMQSSAITQANTTLTMATGSLIPPQRQNSELNDSSDVSDVEELIKQVSKPTLLKNNLHKAEKNKENTSFSSLSNKSSVPTTVNGNTLATTSSCSYTLVEQYQGKEGHQQQQQTQHQQTIPTKQVCVIRPLLAESSKLSQQIEKSNSLDNSEKPEKLDLSATDTLNANKTRDNLVISNLNQSNSCNTLINLNQSSEQLQYQRPALTSREIEKNLINEKKTEQAAIEASTCGAKWPFIKKKSSWSQQMAEAQNNSMVFNFKDRKEVPDYIENDGLFVKRRRELPKPNEPGFVLLGDLSLETSTDPDDAWTMGPPSPCDVEFENANIIIDGKSSIRYKSRDISLKVQFDDTLTSTFEYPSESSLLEDTTVQIQTDTAVSEVATMQNAKINEIIKAPGQKLLGNMSLGSAPLGSYTPIKAQINTTFELGVTRTPIINDGCATQNINNTTNGNQCDINDIIKMNNISSSLQQNNENNLSLINKNGEISNNEQESLPYLKPATDDLTIVYSEGSQKTDLLY